MKTNGEFYIDFDNMMINLVNEVENEFETVIRFFFLFNTIRNTEASVI